jgi:hypothetical protein
MLTAIPATANKNAIARHPRLTAGLARDSAASGATVFRISVRPSRM